MGKRINPNHVKIHRNYTIEEAADLFGVHKNTVRQWIKNGLPICDQRKPILILGSELRDFLKIKRVKNRRSCQIDEIYCVRCKLQKKPALNMVDYEAINECRGWLKAICPTCGHIINKYINAATLSKIQDQFEVTITDSAITHKG